MLVEFASVVNAGQYAIAWQEGMTASEQARDEAEPYDRVLEDIFAVQDEVTQAIVAAIAPELGKAEQLRQFEAALAVDSNLGLAHAGLVDA